MANLKASMSTKKAQTKQKREIYPISASSFIADLGPLLEETTDPLLTPVECQLVLKGIMAFAYQTPVAAAENLFREDQMTNVNVYNIDSLAQIRHRNWQWVFGLFTPSESGESLRELAWGKSKAVLMARLMIPAASSSPEVKDGVSYTRLIIGFWIQKLYEARFPTMMFYEMPECVRSAYHEFLKWKGYQWREKMLSPDAFAKLSKSLYVYSKMEKVRSGGRWRLQKKKFKKGSKDAERKLLIATPEEMNVCSGIGTKGLAFYLSHGFTGTLDEFRDMWKVDPPIEQVVVQVKEEKSEEIQEGEKLPFKKDDKDELVDVEIATKFLNINEPMYEIIQWKTAALKKKTGGVEMKLS